ncbi:hypothetical protein QA640_02630 [Bradyrhizobium sp. CB82]|uniref:hypothetical protein n=1 Tax=Bradyrhizobium sp. CB82 TaxID=3039159 RepID=UPI0024B102FC|nr:hypothetical protein [Bradyrhizobium sp. CB82]WFU41445.1 hypothetical protein QA640_02630 [Bradyrhizobium sp. CB82]
MPFEPRIRVDGPPRDVVPERVRLRPLVSDWSEHELITLPEVVALFWPGGGGPVTLTTIRTAVRDGDLDIVPIAGKFFTTKAAVIRMATPRPHPAPTSATMPPPSPPPADAPAPVVPAIDPVLERIRARRLRAKSRS